MLNGGDYELVLEQDHGFSEDPTNVTENLTEAPNQSSKVSNTPAPNRTPEGKPRCIPQNFNLLQFHYYIISCITSRSWNETLVA
jgi:hypothetical protein